MNSIDANNIINETARGFLVRCAHYRVDVSDEDLQHLIELLETIVGPMVDDSALTGGEWDNA
jgi:hypothetical protein